MVEKDTGHHWRGQSKIAGWYWHVTADRTQIAVAVGDLGKSFYFTRSSLPMEKTFLHASRR